MLESEDRVISEGWHWTYGWLRRPELDVANRGYVYEDGDGALMISKEPIHRRGMYLQCCKDSVTGELYLRVSKAPRICDWRRWFKSKYPQKSR